MDVDRKCGTFIFPQLAELGRTAEIDALVARGGALAEQAAAGSHVGLVEGYQALLGAAQQALRAARADEVSESQVRQVETQARARVSSRLQQARGRLTAAQLTRLEAELARLPDGAEGTDRRLAVIERTLRSRQDAERVREVREAERLRTHAHLVVRPRAQESSHSRRALREQAALLTQLASAVDGPAPAPRNGARALPPRPETAGD